MRNFEKPPNFSESGEEEMEVEQKEKELLQILDDENIENSEKMKKALEFVDGHFFPRDPIPIKRTELEDVSAMHFFEEDKEGNMRKEDHCYEVGGKIDEKGEDKLDILGVAIHEVRHRIQHEKEIEMFSENNLEVFDKVDHPFFDKIRKETGKYSSEVIKEMMEDFKIKKREKGERELTRNDYDAVLIEEICKEMIKEGYSINEALQLVSGDSSNVAKEIEVVEEGESNRGNTGKKEDYILIEKLPDENVDSFAERIIETKEEEKESVRVVFNGRLFEFSPRDKETRESIVEKLNKSSSSSENLEKERERIESRTQARDEILDNNPELLDIYNKYLNLEHNDREGQQKNNIDYKKYPLHELGDAIRRSLPEIPSSCVRLWRGSRKNEVGYNPQYTNSLEGIALPFLRFYDGVLTYIDVPKEEALTYLSSGGVAPGAEFVLPEEILKEVKVVGADEKTEEKMKEEAGPFDELQEGQEDNPYGY